MKFLEGKMKLDKSGEIRKFFNLPLIIVLQDIMRTKEYQVNILSISIKSLFYFLAYHPRI